MTIPGIASFIFFERRTRSFARQVVLPTRQQLYERCHVQQGHDSVAIDVALCQKLTAGK